MDKSCSLPQLDEIQKGLKDFQRRTANTAFQRLYEHSQSTHRFLVADEVGLGKTLIARSVIAQAVHHLWEKVDRIDIVYICSNANIAYQNINRLNVLGSQGKTLPTRMTLLPIELDDLNQNPINLISLTPGTSFDLKSNLGLVDERILLYWLLKDIWGFSETKVAPMNVFQGGVRNYRNFRDQLNEFPMYHRIDQSVSMQFGIMLRDHIRKAKTNRNLDLKTQFKQLCQAYPRVNSKIQQETKRERARFVGELRGLLAQTCVKLLKPDLVILDEFQRFKNIIHGDDASSDLARKLFEYSDKLTEVRVLLLSATPYKMYTLSDEMSDEDHYRDFIHTLGFLYRNEKGEIDCFENCLKEYRDELLRFNSQSFEKLEHLVKELQKKLRQVMVRTERLAVTDDREGMLTKVEPEDVELLPNDALAYVELQSIARELDMPNTIEYWKSSSYLLNFMEDYKLKRTLREELKEGDRRNYLAQELIKTKHLLLSWQDIEKYKELDPRNARLRGLIKQVIGTNMWQLLWLPPSLLYYQLEGPFRNHQYAMITKRLVFSSWRVVPKVISTILSYEAERRSVKLKNPEAQNTENDRVRRGKKTLLRFAIANNLPKGMPVLALLYPSITLAREFDPLNLLRKRCNDKLPKLNQVKKIIRREIIKCLKPLASNYETHVDKQWYWAAPILLDKHYHPTSTEEWFGQPELEEMWMGEEGKGDGSRGDEAWYEHVKRVKQLLKGELKLGQPPEDLAEVLTLLALGGPAICTLRSLDRISSQNLICDVKARNAAAKVGWALRNLYNRAEVMALLRGLKKTFPYWRRVLEYGAEGCLQAVLDEYAHILKDALGFIDESAEGIVDDVSGAMQTALSVRASVLAVDEIRRDNGGAEIKTHRLPSRFAMPFGQGGDDESDDTAATRAQKVRDAFNSPFWPFVVTSTSIGQEGLDFHWYCHAVVHWNLPANPVDMEQREGRVHRYKGHAVRKNVASNYAYNAMRTHDKDPWQTMLKAATNGRSKNENDLVPYWIYPLEEGARIQRHVPSLPLTKDRQLLEALCRSMAVYRLVFGQPRQEDLVKFLNQYVPENRLHELVDRLKINLSP